MKKIILSLALLFSFSANAAPGGKFTFPRIYLDTQGYEWSYQLEPQGCPKGFCSLEIARNTCAAMDAELPSQSDFERLVSDFENSSNRNAKDLRNIIGDGWHFYWTSTPFDSNQNKMTVFYLGLGGGDDNNIVAMSIPNDSDRKWWVRCIRRAEQSKYSGHIGIR